MSTEEMSHQPSCAPILALLDDFVDGQLATRDHRRVGDHLAECEGCRMRFASLQGLLAEVSDLPRAFDPPGDLWSGIAPRLSARARPEPTGRWSGWAGRAAAAIGLMVLGGLLSQWLLSGPGEPALDPAVQQRVADQPAVGERRSDFALAEADYLKAKEVLWAATDGNPELTSPEVREVVERNLRIIDQAIREVRSALQADPGNPQLENLLLTQHRTEIDLLQRLTLGTSEI